MLTTLKNTPKTLLLTATALCCTLLLNGCFKDDKAAEETPKTYGEAIQLSLDLPDSLTGGRVSAATPRVFAAVSDSNQPCAFIGNGNEPDPFRNGYTMTRFMVSTVAAWTCLTDLFVDVATLVPHDGVIRQTENDAGAANYDRDDPTHYSVSGGSSTLTTVRLYYGYARTAPPVASDAPGMFVAWDEGASGAITGRMVIDAELVNGEHRKSDDPVAMRMDFTFNDSAKTADMYLRFDAGNAWAEGLRIQVTQDLTANPTQTVFVARGLADMKRQFVPVDGITELPKFKTYTVSNRLGEGAAIAEFIDVGLALPLNPTNHLGNYLFNKIDTYFFQYDQDWDYVHKIVDTAQLRGQRTTPASGGTWLPFDPSLDLIAQELNLGSGYFANTCAQTGDECSALLNAIIADGFAGQEPNQGSDPLDWRSTAIASPDYLTTVYPNGVSWDGAFDPVFTP